MTRYTASLAILILSLASCAVGVYGQPDRMKVILDTDIDDGWALGFVISYKGFAPLGVTATHRNSGASKHRLQAR
jgi:hypothetical protein